MRLIILIYTVLKLKYLLLGVFTEKPYSKSLEGNEVYIPITCDVKINMVLYSLTGHQRCSAVSRKTACKCLTASILALI